jgi:hypothetical protein
MRQVIEFVLLLTVIFPVAAQGQDKAAEELVRQYLQARSETMEENASSNDIERALSFCTEAFVYEHPSAGARIEGKQKVRSGMTGYLGQTKDATYTLQILASNPHVVVAQIHQQFLVKQENGSWIPGKRSNITIFEIDRGKISRILDY